MPIVSDKYRGSREYALAHSELITAARFRGTVTYQELADLLGWPITGSLMGSRIGHLLGEISEDEHILGRPMLSAVAVGANGKPGKGFFELAKELKKLDRNDGKAKLTFWQSEIQAVYRAWGKRF